MEDPAELGYGSYGPLEQQLVEIVDLETAEPFGASLEQDEEAAPIPVKGKKGQAVQWLGAEGKYVVVTFDGDTVLVPKENLKVYEPLLPEEGGFDLAFPASESRRDVFQSDLVDVLLRQHYCVVQMTSKPDDRQSAVEKAAERGKWVRLAPEFESLYMGRKPDGKKVSWSEGNEEMMDLAGLGEADKMLLQMGFAICPYTAAFGFSGFNRSNTMLHMASSSDEENFLVSVAKTEGKVIEAKELQDHLAFMMRRKICMTYFVNGSGGSLSLHPRGSEGEEVKLACKENQMVVFRHDIFDYTLEGSGEPDQLAMQAWVMRDAQFGEAGMESDANRPDQKTFEELERVPRGPSYSTSDETVDCMALALRGPGQMWFPEGYWGLLAMACDGIILVPVMRWDLDIYWSPENSPGKGYVRHFGMLETEQMTIFDNDFFGMTPQESERHDPPARNILEVGYECLYRGLFTKEKLRGVEITVNLGYAESEFSSLVNRGVHHGIDTDTRTNIMPANVAGRLHFCLGMTGPCMTTETACSSSLSATALMHCWMRPEMPDFTQSAARKQMKYGLASGSNGHFDPFYTISLCGASMLTHGGRCFTFDQSADGFVRGEGTAVMFYKVSQGEDLSRLAMLCGTCMNQDGRSASLTAPHGPSQQECIRHSLREAMISSLDIQIQELHGTGTALGDPIEVGALRATMMTWLGEVREHPLVKTSSKSNLGHTEMCAGILGIMKCVIMGNQVCSAPNIHMRLLNPHMDTNAYPVYFSSEFVDQGKETGYMGVSSFGFGGSNARGDIWARAQSGYRNTNPGGDLLDLSWNRICKFASLFTADLVKPGRELPLPNENWQDFAGDYLTGDPFEGQNAFYVEGTFNGFRAMEKMHYLDDMGGHAFPIVLGDTLMEQFRIVCNRFDDAVVFPMHKFADQEAMVLGPGEAPAGYRWVIDGRDTAKQGDMFLVLFKWDPVAKQKRVTWEMSNHEGAKGLVESMGVYKHFYSIVGSWNNFRSEKMKRVDSDKPGTHVFEFRIGLYGHEEFHLQRDGDKYQTIYPAKNRSLTRDVPVRGPDHFGEEKYWSVVGETGELVRVELEVHEGNITVTLDNKQQGVKKFQSLRGTFRRKYHVYSQWSDWGFTPMGLKDKANTFKAEMTMPEDGPQSFQIVIDENVHQAFHPELEFADQLMSPCQGPDGKGLGLCWSIDEEPGTRVEITLDLNASDRREMVTWKAVSSKQALAN